MCVVQHEISTIIICHLWVQAFSRRHLLKSRAATGNCNVWVYLFLCALIQSQVGDCQVQVLCWAVGYKPYSPLPWEQPPHGGSETYRQAQSGAHLWNLWEVEPYREVTRREEGASWNINKGQNLEAQRWSQGRIESPGHSDVFLSPFGTSSGHHEVESCRNWGSGSARGFPTAVDQNMLEIS